MRPAIHCTETVLIFIPHERADERELRVEGVCGKTEAECLEDLQMLRMGKNIDFGPHLANIYFECDKAAEDRSELGLD